jgi:sporulation protein YlmC with PRC-barrel domain
MKKWILFWLLTIALTACGSASTPLATCESTTPANLMEACLLTGYRVKNPHGELLGQVKAVLVDIGQGQVVYVALAFDDPGIHSKGAMVAVKEKFALIPWAVLTPVPGENALLLNLPHFDRLPAGVSPDLAAQIHQCWATVGCGQ